MAKNFFALTFVVIVAFIAGLPLLHKGLHPTHDGEYHVIRFYQFDKVLRDGNFYPRWAPDLNKGFGVPLFNYVYPFPNYMASLLHLFGISFIDAFKTNMFIAIFTGAIFFYLWASLFWNKIGGVVSSVFYTFSPYHFVDIYIRGSVGEVWALGFFPGVLWAATKFFLEKDEKYGLIVACFTAGIIFSHNILALMFVSFTCFYVVFISFYYQIPKKILLNMFLYIGLGCLLSCIFWLPALTETNFVVGLQLFDIRNNFPQLYQLLIPSWGSGFSEGSLGNELSYQIGIANLLGVTITFIITIFYFIRKQKNAYVLLFFECCFIGVFFMMMNISYVVWEEIPLMKYFQFPWRFLSLEILLASFLLGSIPTVFKKKQATKKVALLSAGILIMICISLGIGYTYPAYYHARDDQYYISRSNFIDGTNSPGDLFNTIWFTNTTPKASKKIVFQSGAQIIKSKIMSNKYHFVIKSSKEQSVLVNTAYFPGWSAFVNGKRVAISKTKEGLFDFSIPRNESTVDIVFLNTFIRSVSSILSLVSLIFFITLCTKYCCVTIKK